MQSTRLPKRLREQEAPSGSGNARTRLLSRRERWKSRVPRREFGWAAVNPRNREILRNATSQSRLFREIPASSKVAREGETTRISLLDSASLSSSRDCLRDFLRLRLAEPLFLFLPLVRSTTLTISHGMLVGRGRRRTTRTKRSGISAARKETADRKRNGLRVSSRFVFFAGTPAKLPLRRVFRPSSYDQAEPPRHGSGSDRSSNQNHDIRAGRLSF